MITGATDDGEPGPLSESFTHWFENTVPQTVLHLEQLALAAVLDERGLDAAAILDRPEMFGSH